MLIQQIQPGTTSGHILIANTGQTCETQEPVMGEQI